MRNRSQINYAALPAHALPNGAIEPDWDAKSLHKYPTWRFGDRNNAAAIGPVRTQTEYPGDQAVFTPMVVAGCCLNIARRNELIERVVRDGLEAHAGTAFAPTNSAYSAVGGFGMGGKILRYFAGVLLNDAAMKAAPPLINFNSDGTGPQMPFFAEDCSTLWSVRKTGDVADAGGTYQGLFGTVERYVGDYQNSHTQADPARLRDSYRLAQFTWTVESVGPDWFTVTAASHDFGKVFQPNNSTDQWANRGCRIMTGANAGKWLFNRSLVGGVDVSWDAATRKLTVETAAADALPSTNRLRRRRWPARRSLSSWRARWTITASPSRRGRCSPSSRITSPTAAGCSTRRHSHRRSSGRTARYPARGGRARRLTWAATGCRRSIPRSPPAGRRSPAHSHNGSSMMTEPVTLELAKLNARVDGNAEDALIEGWIVTGRRWVESYTGHILVARDALRELRAIPPRKLRATRG